MFTYLESLPQPGGQEFLGWFPTGYSSAFLAGSPMPCETGFSRGTDSSIRSFRSHRLREGREMRLKHVPYTKGSGDFSQDAAVENMTHFEISPHFGIFSGQSIPVDALG
jgi:hypothetical protein